MNNEEKVQLVLAEAKRQRISLTNFWDSTESRATYLALYGTYKADIDNSESALVDTVVGPSRRRSSSGRGSRGSRGGPQRLVAPRVSLSPAPAAASGRQNDAEMDIDGSSGHHSRSSAPDVVAPPPPPPPAALAQNPRDMDNLGT
ncbi:hypothetical protein FRC07_014703 [Ceratobasidium sp. 392]|nr:hypothetical protein FRC07_014703 [Ceratobasidium sp. 392]